MRASINRVMILLAALGSSACAFAADASSLKLPRGAKVAIVMFEDLQCPDCARANSMVREVAAAHKVPVVVYDFPLPMHNWAFEAAVWARYFDHISSDRGNDFRKFIYANQLQISRDNLLQWAQKFAGENKTAVPLEKDPDGKLSELVKADFALGQRIGVEHTPTIWVIGNGGVSQPLVEEVKDRDKLGQMIDDILSKAQPVSAVTSPAQKKKPAAKTQKKAS
jgi:protein-disulfide isomerase